VLHQQDICEIHLSRKFENSNIFEFHEYDLVGISLECKECTEILRVEMEQEHDKASSRNKWNTTRTG
jgi:hypothetical protein